MARRRRDLSRSSRYFCSLLLFSFLLFSFFSLNLPKNQNLSSSSVFFFSDRQLCNGVREQCFIISLNQTSPTNLSWNRATEGLHQSNDIFGQKSEEFFDDTSNESRSGPTMGVVTIPLPPTSTVNPTPPSPARLPTPSTMTPANRSCLTLASTTDSTPTMAASPKAFIWTKSEILSLFYSAPKSGDNLTMKMASFPAMSSSTPILDPSTKSRRSRTTTTSRTSTRELGFYLVGLFLNFGPSSKLWPNTKKSGFKSETTRPSFTASKRLPNLNYQDASSAEEDWKKTQVDSKKILAQPHQSAAANLPRQGEAQVTEPSTAPLNLKGTTEDVLSIANLFQKLSFRLIPRSENIIVDVFAKKAIWSMTSGPSMFSVTLCFI